MGPGKFFRQDSNEQGMINGAGWGWIFGWKRLSSWRQWFGLAVAAHTHPSRSAPTVQDFGKAKSGVQHPVLAGDTRGGTSPNLPGKQNSSELVASKGQWGRETVSSNPLS